MEAAPGGGGLGRVHSKLNACLAEGNFYEAHQLYRTLHFRLLAKKDYDKLLNLLFSGALEFLKHKDQQQSAVDIGLLYVDVLMKSKTPVSKEILENLTKLLSGISQSIAERETLISNAIRWSKGEGTVGDPFLHKFVGVLLWKERNYSIAQQHFYNADDGYLLAKLLIEMHEKQGSMQDVDMYISTAILQVLCRKKNRLARDTFTTYVKSHPCLQTDKPPFKTELLNFIWNLMATIDINDSERFKQLLIAYDASIKRDPSYSEYLKKIGRIWFDIIPPKSSNNGLLGNLIQTIFSGMDTEGGASKEEPPTRIPSQSKMQTEDVE